MWPFRRQPALKSNQEVLTDLETRVRRLESDFKALDIEWEQVYEKYRLAMSKLARRDIREASKTDEVAPGATNGHQPIEPPLTLFGLRSRGLLPRR